MNTPLPILTNKRIDSFWARVAITANNNLCWNWNGWVKDNSKLSYGVIYANGKTFATHRIAYLLHYGVDPKDMYVLHTCDNPQCVNPNHFFLGTHQDNMADKMKKGREAHTYGWGKGRTFPKRQGANGSAAKLTDYQVLEIRKEYSTSKIGSRKLAKKYNVSPPTILRIIHRKTWFNI